MWQKCPICDGEGRVTSNGLSSSVHQVCSVCKGTKIISQLNGLSPNSIDKEQQKKMLTEIMEADEKDGLYDQVPDIRKEVSAVEWLVEMLYSPICNGFINGNRRVIPHDIIEQAKQMEREQIINAHYQGYRNFIDTTEISEQYYNETYNTQNK